MMRIRWRMVGPGAAVAMGAGLFAVLAMGHGSTATPQAVEVPLPVRVAEIHLTSADEVVRYAAVVRPRIEADVGFRVGGKVTARLVEVGQRVAAGTTLARLDPNDLELQVRAVAAQLASARADAANASADFKRYASLRQGLWTTQQEYDKRKAVMETAVARVQELEAQLTVARNNAQYATLAADSDGVVTAVLVEPGQVVAQGQPVFRIARLGEMEAVANVPEQQVASLEHAQMAAEVWSLPGLMINGRVRELAPSADAATRTYEARVTLIDPPPQLQLGMTATLVATRPHQGSLAQVPLTALTKSGETPAVWVLNRAGDGIELRPVAVGRYAGEGATITAGLSEGERIVTAGVQKLDGERRVRVWTEPAR
jgi:RND family efflux transporter MFP subunit